MFLVEKGVPTHQLRLKQEWGRGVTSPKPCGQEVEELEGGAGSSESQTGPGGHGTHDHRDVRQPEPPWEALHPRLNPFRGHSP